MKVTTRDSPSTSISYCVALGFFLSIMFTPTAFAADFCERNPTHHKCSDVGDGGNEGEFSYDILYQFGKLDNSGQCTGDCVSSVIRATGSLHCNEQGGCDFHGSIPDDALPFFLPDSLMDMLSGTQWKGTDLDPDACFGAPPSTDPAGRNVELARNIVDGTWFAAIGSYAGDVDALTDVQRKYVFYFTGCDDPPCGAWEPLSMSGYYFRGELLRIESPPKDRKLKSTPCRCTISNDPDGCPTTSVPMSVSVVAVTE